MTRAELTRLARHIAGEEMSDEELEAALDRMIEREMAARRRWTCAMDAYEQRVIGICADIIKAAKSVRAC